jgi:hypothetical protein
LRDFVTAEPVSHDIDDFLQAEIRQAGKDLGGGRVTRAGDVWKLHLCSSTQERICGQIAAAETAIATDLPCQAWLATWIPSTENERPSGFRARTGPPEQPSGVLQMSNRIFSSEELAMMRQSLSADILCGLRLE